MSYLWCFQDVLPDVGYSDTEYTEDGCKIPQEPTLNDSIASKKENKFREAVTTRLKVDEILRQKCRRFEGSPKCRSRASSFHHSGRTSPNFDVPDGHNLTTKPKASFSCPAAVDFDDKKAGSDDIKHSTSDEKVMNNMPNAQESDAAVDSGLQNLSYTSEASNTSISSADIIMGLSGVKGNIGDLRKVEESPSEAKNDVSLEEKHVEIEDPTTDDVEEHVVNEDSRDLKNLAMESEKSEELISKAEIFDDSEEKKENPYDVKVEDDALCHVQAEPDVNLHNPEENLKILQKDPTCDENKEKIVDYAEITDDNESKSSREVTTYSEQIFKDDIGSISAMGDMERHDITHDELLCLISIHSDARSDSTVCNESVDQEEDYLPFGKINDAFYRDEMSTFSDMTLDEEDVQNLTRSEKKERGAEDTKVMGPSLAGDSKTRRQFRSESPHFTDVTIDLQRSNASTPVVGNEVKSCYNGGNSKTTRRVSFNEKVRVRQKSDFAPDISPNSNWASGPYNFTDHGRSRNQDNETSNTEGLEDETTKFYRYFGFLRGAELKDTQVLIMVDGTDSDLDEEP
uniref:Dentin sialophosphoprotein-like n=1 Tax=Bursaphelenchus xylophilus TaxID=6326 RepID=A0A1I7SFZ4_BURXY